MEETLPTLALPPAERKRLEEWAVKDYPRESCGVLVGTRRGARTAVWRVRRARNLSDQPDRFELDPAALVRAEDDAHLSGLEVVGVWHSHPDRSAHPSARDLEAACSTWSHLIVAVSAEGAGDLRSWRVRGAALCEEGLAR